MGLMALAFSGLLLGVWLGRSWAVAIPLALGASVALGLSATGHDLTDTPVVFLVVVATGAVGAGIAVRRLRRQTPT